jgi:sorting nexin-29
VPEPSAFEVEIAIEKPKTYKSPGIEQIPAELVKSGGRTIRSEIHKIINSVWSEEEWPEEWKELIIVPVYKKGDKTDCSNYRGISLLTITYKILSKVLLPRLTSYAEEIIVDHQFRFRRNRSTTDHICSAFVIYFRKKLEYNEAVFRLFINFKKAYDSVRREVLCNMLIDFGIPMKLVRLITSCLPETYSRVRVDKNLSDTLLIRNGL